MPQRSEYGAKEDMNRMTLDGECRLILVQKLNKIGPAEAMPVPRGRVFVAVPRF